MMKKVTIKFIYLFLIVCGVLFTFALDFYTNGTNYTSHFSVNENGQTYGSALLSENEAVRYPDLILAIGVDGTEGFVLRDDLEGTGPIERPKNPEEAVIYMEQLNELIYEAEANAMAEGLELHEVFLYYIPLYASDGITVIGQFGISMPEVIE